MNNTTQAKWDICFDQFMVMGDWSRQILRRCAANRLVDNGFEEVGSSDVNHELFAMWNSNSEDWQKVMVAELYHFAATNR